MQFSGLTAESLQSEINLSCRKAFRSPFTPYILILTHQLETVLENIVGKGETARNEQFLLFRNVFYAFI